MATAVAGSRAAMLLHFDDVCDIVAASAQDRPRAVGNSVVETPFAGEYGDYQVFDGLRLPTSAAVRWELPDTRLARSAAIVRTRNSRVYGL